MLMSFTKAIGLKFTTLSYPVFILLNTPEYMSEKPFCKSLPRLLAVSICAENNCFTPFVILVGSAVKAPSKTLPTPLNVSATPLANVLYRVLFFPN